ncbi:MAG: hypothetical protein QOC83_6845, partial [Pseudonocardiales bacterium]|nr:hypothetical protein [Pseudonocardiales bacterium]
MARDRGGPSRGHTGERTLGRTVGAGEPPVPSADRPAVVRAERSAMRSGARTVRVGWALPA